MITTVSRKKKSAPDESGQNVCVPATSECILECTQFVLFPFLGTIDCLNYFTMEPNSFHILSLQEVILANGNQEYEVFRECVSTGAAGAHNLRSLGHHLLHPLILRLLVLCAPADFEA